MSYRVRAGCILITLLCTLMSVVTTSADAEQLITNGSFETGTLAGWTVVTQLGSGGTFLIDDNDRVTPVSLLGSVGSATGSFYAVSDSTGQGAQALLQTFMVPTGISAVTLSFDMFVNDWSGEGPIVNPVGLDYTVDPNQHARVDILSAGTPPLETGAGILQNLYLGVDLGFPPHTYTHYVFDITTLVGTGGTFQLRFAQVDTRFFLNQGIDNVSIVTTDITDIPETGTWTLMVSGLLPLAGMARRRRV